MHRYQVGTPIMNFYFCEKCGARITDVDIAAGKGRDKKFSGVYCEACSIGVMTMETLPMNERQAKAILKDHPTSQAVPIRPAQAKTKTSAVAPISRSRNAAVAPPRKNNAALFVGFAVGTGAVIGVVGFFAMRGGGDRQAPAAAAAPPKPVASTPAATPPPKAPAPAPLPVSKPEPPTSTPVPPPEKQPEPAKTPEPAPAKAPELPKPPEPVPLPAFEPVAVFVDNFADGNWNAADEGLANGKTQGLSWRKPVDSPKYTIQNARLHEPVEDGSSWLFSVQGEDWRDYMLELSSNNRYTVAGGGVLVLAKDEKNAYWFDIARDTGRLVRFMVDAAGNPTTTELGANKALRLPHRGDKSYRIRVKHLDDGILFSADGGADGKVDLEFVDKDPQALKTFAQGGIGFHRDTPRKWNHVNYGDIKVSVEKLAEK